MKFPILLLLILNLLSYWHTAIAADWLIVPGVRVGPITKSTNEEKLIELFGSAQVKSGDIYMGEGSSESGTIIFPNTPNKTLMILWSDKAHKEVSQIQINADTTLWKTDNGITIGTPLSTIEKLNGAPVILTGFGWDYDGTLIDTNGGRLSKHLALRLSPTSEQQSLEEYSSLLGDREFLSTDPAMKKLDPKVYEMIFSFY